MKKSDINKMPPYFDRYIDLAEDLPLLESLELSLKELHSLPLEKWKQVGDNVYAPGKWTLKDILQHFIDTERVFVYRITAIARGDKQKMNPYDEEKFAKNTTAQSRTLEDLLDELILIRKATIAMFRSFTADMLHQQGNGVNGMFYCPLSLGFMLAGHQRWHFNTIEQKYLPLAKD
ncbi:MAG: DinB family protein [Saprospiraceae bacterium]|nr:DinB family protein [Saprospiraceae bacterium]MBL0083003.1 DinB family protein [Saprospiraceae bacterium]